MKNGVYGVLLLIIGGGLWVIGTRLSDDALGLVIGFVFGILAGIPSCMMLLASQRRSEPKQKEYDHPQYPMIVLQGGQPGGYEQVSHPQMPMLPARTVNSEKYEETDW